MSRRPPIYPVFIPHAGCPFQCIYCDQRQVTSTSLSLPGIENALAQVKFFASQATNGAALGEIAFYGGSFTGLPYALQQQFLGLAQQYVDQGVFKGIRFSTRPDQVDSDVLRRLAGYTVTTVELGIQSLSDTVLNSSRRGYDRRRALDALELLRRRPWQVGVQLMLGLPSDTAERFLQSVRAAIEVRPDFIRIHPTLVFSGTELASWAATGQYVPLNLKEAVDWCVPAYEACIQAGIPIARLGLLVPSRLTNDTMTVAGPWHPAYGHLVRSAWWRQRIDALLRKWPKEVAGSLVVIRVGQRHLSDALGWKRENVDHWRQTWDLKDVSVEPVLEESGVDFELAVSLGTSSRRLGQHLQAEIAIS